MYTLHGMVKRKIIDSGFHIDTGLSFYFKTVFWGIADFRKQWPPTPDAPSVANKVYRIPIEYCAPVEHVLRSFYVKL